MPTLPIPLSTLFQLLAAAASSPQFQAVLASPQMQEFSGHLLTGLTNIITQTHALGPQIIAGNQTADPLHQFASLELQRIAALINPAAPPTTSPTS